MDVLQPWKILPAIGCDRHKGNGFLQKPNKNPLEVKLYLSLQIRLFCKSWSYTGDFLVKIPMKQAVVSWPMTGHGSPWVFFKVSTM